MRFIGNKENLVEKIHSVLKEEKIKGDSFFDFFAGTTSVGRYFKNQGIQILSSDLMYFSYVLQKAYIENNNEPLFEKLLTNITVIGNKLFNTPLELVVSYLNKIEGVEGFIYNNYTPKGSSQLDRPRMYFSDENGRKIDAIRTKIEEWHKSELLKESEYFILISCLIETVPFYANISGVYAAFRKKWDPRSVKTLNLRSIKTHQNNYENKVFNVDSVNLLDRIEADVFYLDPPYNERQYAPNYHILETIARYDNPTIKGITGLRNYDEQKSKFCNAKNAIIELDKIAKLGKFKYLVMSYNSEGIMPCSDIISTLSKYGKVKLKEFEYLRFKSNNNGESKTKKFINEQLYILEKRQNNN